MNCHIMDGIYRADYAAIRTGYVNFSYRDVNETRTFSGQGIRIFMIKIKTNIRDDLRMRSLPAGSG